MGPGSTERFASGLISAVGLYIFVCWCRRFTKFSRVEYLKLRSGGRIVPDGSHAKVNNTPSSTEYLSSVLVLDTVWSYALA
jgi:hypothetical protein